MPKWILTILIVLVVAGGVAVGLGAFGSGAPVEGAKVRKGPIQEFVDERGKTRLPQVYAITMPFDGRIAPIDRLEGTPVKPGEVVAQVVSLDLKLSHEAAAAALDRLDASIKENDDASVERVSLEQSLKMVESMHSSVLAAGAQVEAARAKLDYNNKNLARIQSLVQSKAKSEDEYEQTRLAQIQSDIEVRQDEMLLSAMKAMESATLLLPKVITEYIGRKTLARNVLEKQKSEAQVTLEQVKKNEERGQMKSPIDGVVLERAISDERQVPAGTVLLKIGRLEELQVEADVLSQDVVEVKAGDDVEITGPAIGKTPAHGTVERIYPAGFTKVSSLGVEQQRVKVIVGFSSADLEPGAPRTRAGDRLSRVAADHHPLEAGGARCSAFGSVSRRRGEMASLCGPRRPRPLAAGRDRADERRDGRGRQRPGRRRSGRARSGNEPRRRHSRQCTTPRLGRIARRALGRLTFRQK